MTSTTRKQPVLTALVGILLASAALGGGWTLYDEQESSTEAVLNSCNAQGVCTTPLNFNGDINANTGQPIVDLAVANDFGGPIRLYIGTAEQGRGFTSSFDLWESTASVRTTGLRFADLDNDGDVEMLQATRGSGNYVYRFRYADPPFYCASTPCFDAQLANVRLGTTDADNSQGLAVGDLNLDCQIDVFVVNGVANGGDQSNKVYLNQTGGPGLPIAPGAACPAPADNANALAFGPAIIVPSAGVGAADSDSRKAELVDVDADGDLDAIVANADANDNWLYINQTRPLPSGVTLFAAPVPLTAAAGDDAESARGLAVGDLDNDGDTDIVVANNGTSNRYYLNTGAGATRFSANSGTFGDANDASTAVKLGDVNRDTYLDAVVTNDPGPSRVHLNFLSAGQGFVDKTIVNPVGVPGTQPFNLTASRALDLGKLDNDGWLDLVVANSNSQYNLRFLNNATCFSPGGSPLNCDPFLNSVPTITAQAGAPLTTNEDAPLALTIASITATDADNLAADLRLALEPGTNYTVNGPAITPALNYAGPLTVNVRVTDLTSLSTPFALNVTVTPLPDAPTFTSTATTTAAQGIEYTYNVTTADPDVGEARTIAAATKPAWLALTDNGNGTATLRGTPGGTDVGDHAVVLEVRDAGNMVASQSFSVTVGNTNDPPVFASTAVTAATEGTAYSYAVNTSDPDAGDTRTITATTKPAWLTLTTGANGTATLAGTPTSANLGANAVTLTVTDAAGASATQIFTVTVTAAPVVAPPSGGGGGGGGGSAGVLEVLALLAGLGGVLRRRRSV